MQDIFTELEILNIVCFILWRNSKEIRMILLKLKIVKGSTENQGVSHVFIY